MLICLKPITLLPEERGYNHTLSPTHTLINMRLENIHTIGHLQAQNIHHPLNPKQIHTQRKHLFVLYLYKAFVFIYTYYSNMRLVKCFKVSERSSNQSCIQIQYEQ